MGKSTQTINKMNKIIDNYFIRLDKQKEKERKAKITARRIARNKANLVRTEFHMDARRDKKVVEWLNKQPNKSFYLRNLIKKDMRERA